MRKQQTRVKLLNEVNEGVMKAEEAAGLLGVSPRAASSEGIRNAAFAPPGKTQEQYDHVHTIREPKARAASDAVFHAAGSSALAIFHVP